MLFSSLLLKKALFTMLDPDPGYEAWTTAEGLDGETDFHIADSPFMYTNGWDFVGVRLLKYIYEVSALTDSSRSRFGIDQSKYLPDGVSRGGTPFGGDAPGANGAGGDNDKNMFGEPI